MDSPHSSATFAAMLARYPGGRVDEATAMPVYQTLLPFFPLQFTEGAWCGGSGDETRWADNTYFTVH